MDFMHWVFEYVLYSTYVPAKSFNVKKPGLQLQKILVHLSLTLHQYNKAPACVNKNGLLLGEKKYGKELQDGKNGSHLENIQDVNREGGKKSSSISQMGKTKPRREEEMR